MISVDTIAAFEKFTSTVKRSTQARSKDIRIDMTDAINLMAEIANVMTRLAVYENASKERLTKTSVQMDGGIFGDK